MDSKEIKVTFETITPLYTGDAWQEFKEIRPSSLIGSLRFWFEVICYFGGVCSKEEFNNEQGRFERIVDSDTGKSENGIKNEKFKKLLLKHGTDFYGQIEALKEFKIPVPAIIFGTTGWKGLIEIKEVKPIKDYCFGNKLNLQYKFFVSKNGNQEIKEGKYYDKKSNSYESVFYFKIPYFWGKFEVIFRVYEEIKETILFPLLSFMDKYGYWGGGWNIGYGRLKVKEININKQLIERTNWQKNEFDFSKFKFSGECSKGNWNGNFNSLISTVNYNNSIDDKNIDKIFNSLLSKEVKVIQVQIEKCNEINFKENVKTLIKMKAELRKKYKLNTQNDEVKRHEIFGYSKSKSTKGSKILPYINKLDNNTYERGLLSIAGILKLHQEKENEQ